MSQNNPATLTPKQLNPSWSRPGYKARYFIIKRRFSYEINLSGLFLSLSGENTRSYPKQKYISLFMKLLTIFDFQCSYFVLLSSFHLLFIQGINPPGGYNTCNNSSSSLPFLFALLLNVLRLK